jgi:hypothetical protein
MSAWTAVRMCTSQVVPNTLFNTSNTVAIDARIIIVIAQAFHVVVPSSPSRRNTANDTARTPFQTIHRLFVFMVIDWMSRKKNRL